MLHTTGNHSNISYCTSLLIELFYLRHLRLSLEKLNWDNDIFNINGAR